MSILLVYKLLLLIKNSNEKTAQFITKETRWTIVGRNCIKTIFRQLQSRNHRNNIYYLVRLKANYLQRRDRRGKENSLVAEGRSLFIEAWIFPSFTENTATPYIQPVRALHLPGLIFEIMLCFLEILLDYLVVSPVGVVLRIMQAVRGKECMVIRKIQANEKFCELRSLSKMTFCHKLHAI